MENLPDFEKQIAGMIRELATAFTVNHAALKISVQPLASRTVINVTPHIDDYGKMVGTSGVRVNALRPGIIDTEIHNSSGIPGRVKMMRDAIPMKRVGQPEDIPGAVCFLASDDAAFITGQTLSVSGGLTMV